jgi:hypothetical protein
MKYVDDKGTCIVKLKKALYGCVESAKLWYDKVSRDLSVLGYTANAYDRCVFNRTENNKSQTALIIHVDSMMISCCNDKYVDIVVRLSNSCHLLAFAAKVEKKLQSSFSIQGAIE